MRDVNQAAGDDEIIHIDEADAALMCQIRAPDNVDIVDVMTDSITSCVSKLTATLQVPRVPLPYPTQAQPRSIPSLFD